MSIPSRLVTAPTKGPHFHAFLPTLDLPRAHTQKMGGRRKNHFFLLLFQSGKLRAVDGYDFFGGLTSSSLTIVPKHTSRKGGGGGGGRFPFFRLEGVPYNNGVVGRGQTRKFRLPPPPLSFSYLNFFVFFLLPAQTQQQPL